MEEEWRDVVGFEGFYQVSNLGQVRRVFRERCEGCGNPGNAEKILKTSVVSKNPYVICAFSKPGMGGKTLTRTVHRLVAKAFVRGETPIKKWVNHKDGNKRNNRAENLEWLSPSENQKHAIRLGLAKVPAYVNPWPKRARNLLSQESRQSRISER